LFIVSDLKIYIKSRDREDFAPEQFKLVSKREIIYLDEQFTVNEESFEKIPNNSLVILDDFSMQINKQSKTEFLKIVNFTLRHKNICLFCIVHNLYNIGLYNEILLAPHLFLAYTNLGYYIMKKIQPRIGNSTKVFNFFNEVVKMNFHFIYINSNKNYMINCVEKLFSGECTTMFLNDQVFKIHKATKFCTKERPKEIDNDLSALHVKVKEFLDLVYPKNKVIFVAFKILISNNLINDNLFFKEFPNLHIADFSSMLNNRFAKKEQMDPKLLKLCKYLQNKGIRLPKICVKNPNVINFLT